MGQVCGCQIMTGPLDAEAVRRSVENLRYGEVVTLTAEVPGTHKGDPVETMVFSADEERALFQMFAIAEEAAKRWDANVAIMQRLGELIPGDTHLLVAVAATQRADAFDCCRYIADAIAERVPVWGA